MTDLELLIRDKYEGDATQVTDEDRERLTAGEPLAYIIGWVPFLGLRLRLDSHPLIPRPETEWWTELLTRHIGDQPLSVLDLCAGSGAIGLALADRCPHATVALVEVDEAHAALIEQNREANSIDAARVRIKAGDLFAPFADERFDLIATNPPYIPSARVLPASVVSFEPTEALYAGPDGLALIRRIIKLAPAHLTPGGELWMECDIENIEEAKALMLLEGAASALIRNDPYGRPRVCVGYYP